MNKQQLDICIIIYALGKENIPATTEKIKDRLTILGGLGIDNPESVINYLIAQGKVILTDNIYSLDCKTKKLADDELMKINQAEFDETLIRYAGSNAYKKFCKEVYNLDFPVFSPFCQKEFNYLLENSYVNHETTILDMGCGFGGFAKYIADKFGCNITAFDFAPGIINQLVQSNTNSKLKYINLSFEQVDEIKGSFDFIIAFDSITSCQDINELFKKVKKMLNKNGIFFIFQTFLGKSNANNVLQGLRKAGFKIQTTDFSSSNINNYKKAFNIAKEMKNDFIKEDNLELLQISMSEINNTLTHFEQNLAARYCFIATI